MEPIINQIHKSLLKRQKTIAVAESCTGGLLSTLLTSACGSSKYFKLGVVTYSNRAKSKILGIPASLIAKHGAVSSQVTIKMAQSVRKIAKTDIGISITGIAGPTGGTTNKPVGTVFIAITSSKKKLCKKFSFQGNRTAIRKKSALKALVLLKELL